MILKTVIPWTYSILVRSCSVLNLVLFVISLLLINLLFMFSLYNICYHCLQLFLLYLGLSEVRFKILCIFSTSTNIAVFLCIVICFIFSVSLHHTLLPKIRYAMWTVSHVILLEYVNNHRCIAYMCLTGFHGNNWWRRLRPQTANVYAS